MSTFRENKTHTSVSDFMRDFTDGYQGLLSSMDWIDDSDDKSTKTDEEEVIIPPQNTKE